jgi:hypothetical protein
LGHISPSKPQKLKAGSITRNPPTETIGHAGAGGEKGADLHRLGCHHQAVKIFKASRRSSVRHHDFPPDAKTVSFSFASQFITDVPADKRPS